MNEYRVYADPEQPEVWGVFCHLEDGKIFRASSFRDYDSAVAEANERSVAERAAEVNKMLAQKDVSDVASIYDAFVAFYVRASSNNSPVVRRALSQRVRNTSARNISERVLLDAVVAFMERENP
jgi:hypothetical protein